MYEVIDASCYLDTITEKIKKSKNKIYIQAMHIDFSKKFEIFIDEIIKAKKRGVDVKFNIDEYSIPYIVGHKYYHISQYKRINCNTKSEKNKYYLDKLIKEKIDIKFINEYKYGRIVSEYLPFFGRNHMKITIIDDVSFIGGINLAEKSLDYLDFMVRIKNKKLNLLLIDIFIKNRDGRKNNDITIPIDKLNDLIIDSGRRFKSQIYKETLDSIRKAEQSIIFISQFLPDFNIV